MSIHELAALAVKNNSKETLEECFDLLNKVDDSDYRDTITLIAIVYDGAVRLGLNPESFFQSGLDRITAEHVKNEIVKFIKRQPHNKRIEAFGYKLFLEPIPEYKFSF